MSVPAASVTRLSSYRQISLPSLRWPASEAASDGDAFHQVAVADDRVGVVIDDVEFGAVVARRELRFGDRHADRIGQALPERSGGDFDAGRVAALGMPGRLAAPLAKLA